MKNKELESLLKQLDSEKELEKKEEKLKRRKKMQQEKLDDAEKKKRRRRQVIEININESEDVIIEDDEEMSEEELDIEEAIASLDTELQEYANLLRDDLEDYYSLIEASDPSQGYKSGADDVAPAGHQWVYMFLVNSRTTMSKVIKHFTKQPYNHASLSFDRSLTNMYSFTMAKAHGYTKENVHSSYPENAEFSLYKIAVPKDSVAVMKDAINNVEKFQDQYRYSTKGLLGFVFKRHQDKFNTKEKAMFCSQFCARMFATAGMKIFNGKEDYEIRPYDFAKNSNFKFCYRGLVKNFDPTKIR